MRWTQDGRYGRPPRRSRIPDSAGAAVGAVAALPAALPHQLRRSSSERRIKRFHSRLVWRVAAAGPAVAGSPLWAMWGRYLCAEIWRRFKCQSTLSLSRAGWGFCRRRKWPAQVSPTAGARGRGGPSFNDPRGRTRAIAQEADPLSTTDPGMASLLANSVRRKIAVGSNAGRGLVRLGDRIDGDDLDAFQSPRCAMVSGFSVHANVSIEARDRDRLERLCRYAGRPAVATERLTLLPDGRLLYRLKRPWRDGTSAVIFEPQDFIAKLAVLVPVPRAHLTRYHGVFAPAAAWRSLVVPTLDFQTNEIGSNAVYATPPATILTVDTEPI